MTPRSLRLPLCNGRCHTAPVLFGQTFPLCWRCTSIIGASAMTVPLYSDATSVPGAEVAVAFTLVIIGAWDGYRSYFTGTGTTNLRRVIFGAYLGIGASIMVASVLLWLDRL
jgi:uncharacterized membrane protein